MTYLAPDHVLSRLWTYPALAHAYTALGDKKAAIAKGQIALRSVPPDQQANVPNFERALQALKGAL